MKVIVDKEFLQKKLIPFLLFIIAIYFPIFHQLGSDALGMWDEALFALRAYHLAFTDQYLLNFREIEPLFVHPNTKPPLMTWVQAGFFRAFGYSELSLRLPIALSVLAMVFFMVRFAKTELNNSTVGYLAALVLVTSLGFMNKHSARTGDHDAVLAFEYLFIFAYFYKTIAYPEKQQKYVWIVALFLAAAVLTKSVAGLFPLPALLVYAFYKKRVLGLLKSWHTWGAIAMFLVLVLGYYFYREWQLPGFLQRVWEEEIGGRYTSGNPGHQHPFYHYYQLLFDWQFVPWLFFLPLSIVTFFTERGKPYRDFNLLLLLAVIVHTTILANSDSKADWYLAGAFPLLSMIVAVGLAHIYNGLQQYLSVSSLWKKQLLGFFLIASLFAYPYIKVIEQNAMPRKEWVKEQFGEYMRNMDPSLNYTVATDGLNICVTFYQRVATNIEGRNIPHKQITDSFVVGELVMCTENLLWTKERYRVKVIDSFKKLRMIEIIGYK